MNDEDTQAPAQEGATDESPAETPNTPPDTDAAPEGESKPVDGAPEDGVSGSDGEAAPASVDEPRGA